MFVMREKSLLLMLSCSATTWIWNARLGYAMNYVGGARKMTQCEKSGGIHSNFGADPIPLADEVETYVKKNCKFLIS